MKKGWTTKKLGEVCVKCDLPKATVGSTPYVEIGDVDVVRKDILFKEKGAVKGSMIAPGKSVLVSRVRPTRGAVTILESDSAISSAFSVLRPTAELELRLLFLCLAHSPDFADYLAERQKGLLYPSVKEEDVLDYRIEFPVSLAEQQRIVGVLDEAFEGLATAKANAEKNLQNARALFESHLQSVFTQRGTGWVEKTLGDVCETTQGVQIPKNLHFKSPGENRRRYLYISDFDHDENLKYVDDIFPKKRVTENDLIVVNTGATAGKIFRGIDGVLSNNLFKVTLNQGIDSDFLYYFVTSSLFKEHQKKIVKGTANPHMGHENFKSTPANIPPLDVQLETVVKLDELAEETQRLARLYERKHAALEALKKSLLHQAFTGEL